MEVQKLTGNEPAMPVNEEVTDRIDQNVKIYTGLTIRQHFAAMAAQGILSANKQIEYGDYENMRSMSPSEVANQAVCIADALIDELNKNS
jgi:hypothetical protein